MNLSRHLVFVYILAVAAISSESLADFEPHYIQRGDGQGGWILQDAESQLLQYSGGGGGFVFGFGQ